MYYDSPPSALLSHSSSRLPRWQKSNQTLLVLWPPRGLLVFLLFLLFFPSKTPLGCSSSKLLPPSLISTQSVFTGIWCWKFIFVDFFVWVPDWWCSSWWGWTWSSFISFLLFLCSFLQKHIALILVFFSSSGLLSWQLLLCAHNILRHI